MTLFKTSLLKSVFGVGLFAGLAVAGECIYGGGQTPEVSISISNLRSPDAWNEIANKLAGLGDLYKDIEGTIRVPVKVPNAPAAFPVQMAKICGETLRQAALNVAEAAERMMSEGGAGGGGGGGGTGTTTGIIGWMPIYSTGQVCTPSACTTTTIVIGYEPIYGPIPAPGERQFTDKVT